MHHITKNQSITSILLLCLACAKITGTGIKQQNNHPAYTLCTSLLNSVSIVYSKEWENSNKDPSKAVIGTLNITEESDLNQLNQYRKILENQKNTSRPNHTHHPITLLIRLQEPTKNHNIYQKINKTTFNKNPYHLLPIAIILDKISEKIKCIDIKKSLCMRANNKITIADICLFYKEEELKNNTSLGSLLHKNTNTSKDNNTDLRILYSLSANYINAFERREIQKSKNRLKDLLYITENKATDILNICTEGIEELQAINSNLNPIIKLKIKLEENEPFATYKNMIADVKRNHVLEKEYTFPDLNINTSILNIKKSLIDILGKPFDKKYLKMTHNNNPVQNNQTLGEIAQDKNSKHITLKYKLCYFPLLYYTLSQIKG